MLRSDTISFVDSLLARKLKLLLFILIDFCNDQFKKNSAFLAEKPGSIKLKILVGSFLVFVKKKLLTTKFFCHVAAKDMIKNCVLKRAIKKIRQAFDVQTK